MNVPSPYVGDRTTTTAEGTFIDSIKPDNVDLSSAAYAGSDAGAVGAAVPVLGPDGVPAEHAATSTMLTTMAAHDTFRRTTEIDADDRCRLNDDPLAFRRRYAGVAPDGMQLDPPFLRTVVVGEPGTIDPYGYWRGMREIDEAGPILVTGACTPSGAPRWC